MNDLTNEQLAEIKARADAATPGPWGTFDTDDEVHMCAIGVSTNGHEPWFELNASEDENGHQHVVAMTLLQSPRYACHASGKWTEDAEFIAHARTDIPVLLAEVERLRAELARLRPLAEAAVAVAKADTGSFVDAGQWQLLKAAVKYARAQAQAGEGA